MNFHVVTLFPEMFGSYLGESILGRAIKEKKITVSFINPRNFVSGKYGGGPGMVMMAEPIIKAVEQITKKISKKKKSKVLIINFIPSSEKFTTKAAKNISKKYTDVVMICGRYEGIDARVDKILKTKKFSIGDYVLTGGEIPAMALIDSISRQVEGVLGNFDSREEERTSSSEVYTRPEILIHNKKKHRVPKVLLSGHQKKIEEWKLTNKSK